MDKDEILKSLLILDLRGALENGRVFFKKHKKAGSSLKNAKVIILDSKSGIGSSVAHSLFSLGLKRAKNKSVSQIKDIKDLIRGCDLVIGCSGINSAQRCLAINKTCIQKHIPWINAELDRTQAVIGPTVLPGQSSCYNCYRLRLKENENVREPDYILKAKDSDLVWNIRLIKQAIANYVSLEAMKVLTGACKPILVNRIVTLTPAEPFGKFDELIKKSTCTHCGVDELADKNNLLTVGNKKAITLIDRESIYEENGLRIVHSFETLRRMERLIGKVGIITEVRKMEDEKIFPVFHVISADPVGNNRYRDHLGKGITPQQSLVSALAEAIERYCAKMHGDEEIITASFKDVKKYAIDPEKFILPLNYPIKYSENLNIDWSWGYSLSNKKSVLVPSNFVYCPYIPQAKAKRIWAGDSNGLAAGNCLEEAILHGIFEVIERDAYTIVERNSLCMPDVTIKNVRNKYIHQILDKLKEMGISFYVKNLTTDIKIPTFGIFLKHISEETRKIDIFSYAVGIHLNPELALLRSLSEALQIYPVYLSKWLDQNPGYKIKHRFHRGSSAIQIGKIPDFSSTNIKTDIETCVGIIKDLGMEIIVVDLTRPNIDFPVVRVLIPGLQPIYTPPFFRFSRRLFEVPRRLGYKLSIKKDIYNQKMPNMLGAMPTRRRLCQLARKINVQKEDAGRPFPVRPKIINRFDVTFIDKDKVVFKSSDKSFAMEIKDRDGFKRLISLLDGRHTLSEIIRNLKS